MAGCAHCGAVLEPGTLTCPGCGLRGAGGVTLPLGSEGERPLGSGTLVLGSGAPLLPHEPPARPPPAPVDPRPPGPRRDPLAQRRRVARVEPPAPAQPDRSRRRRRPVWPLLAALAALALGGFLALGRRAPAVVGEARFDPGGRPRLLLRCPDCPDGTLLTAAGESGVVQSGRAELGLAPPVALGRHRADVEVRAPGRPPRRGRLEYVVSHVLNVDQRGLGHPDPKLAIVFEAPPDVAVVVDGRVVEPAPGGLRRHEIPLRAELTGPARAPEHLRKTIPYLVKPTVGEPIRGEVEIALEVVPLVVDAPRQSVVIEGTSFMLAGSTASDGMVTVDGRPITVDPAGRFSQLMSVSAVGATTVHVRATAPGRAPRIVPIRVKRVASLAAEAAEFERRAQSSYAAISEDVEAKLGWAVVLEGRVSEVRSDGYVSSLLLDVTRGCKDPPCRARLALGERSSLRPGATVIAYGHLAGKSADPVTGRGVPEVRVEFLRGKE